MRRSIDRKIEKSVKGVKGDDTNFVVSDPKVVEFSSYDAVSVYERNITFKNFSSTSRYFRVLGPTTSFFSMSPLVYPKSCESGCIAPGMVVSAIITFMPQSLGDYEDRLVVQSEGGSYSVPIKAHREAPKLSLPSIINVGACLVGDAVRIALDCSNTGGPGRFRLLSLEDYPNIPEGKIHL